jgi:long-chain acyl-CoA synthetase
MTGASGIHQQDTLTTTDTIPKLFLKACRKWGNNKVAMQKKEFGIWNEYTWARVYEEVRNLSGGLISLGFSKGNKLAIIGDNCPEWFCTEYAALALGGVVVGLYADASRNELEYIVESCDAQFVFVSDQEQVDKFLDIKDKLPKLERVIYWDPQGLWKYDNPILLSWSDVIEMGRKYSAEHPGFFEKSVEDTRAEDIALLLYTSGTSALPKGAMITHRTLTKASQDWFTVEKSDPSDQYVSYMAPAWIAEQTYGIVGLVVANYEVSFPEKPETTQADIREIAPNMLFFGSRLWENVASSIQARMSDSTWLKRIIYNLAVKIGYKAAYNRLENKPINIFLKAAFYLNDLMVLRPLRDKIGCLKAKHVYTGGALLSPDTIFFFHAINVQIRNNYGLTEVIPGTLQRMNDVDVDTVGSPLGNEIRITDDNEIVLRGYGTFQGYYKNPEETAKIKDEHGWLHTGDAGFFTDHGHLVYMDRVKELIEIKDGSKFSPAYIEGKMRFSQYIADAMVVGGKERDYVAALVQIDSENVGKWAEKNKINYTTFTDLSQKDEVQQLIKKEVERVNKALPDSSKIMRFCNFYKQLDPDESELTRTRKLRRTYIEQKYKTLIDAIYSDKNCCVLEADVVYQNGRKSKITTEVKIIDL